MVNIVCETVNWSDTGNNLNFSETIAAPPRLAAEMNAFLILVNKSNEKNGYLEFMKSAKTPIHILGLFKRLRSIR